MLGRGAKPNSPGRTHRPIIFSAIEMDSSATVQVILDFKGDLEYCGGTNGETPLQWAAARGSLSCLKLLLKVANTAATDSSGKGVLSVAICHKQAAVVEILFQRSEVDVTLCDEQGISPLRHAIREGQHLVVKALLKNPQVEDSTRDAANDGILHEAIERDHLEIVRALLSCGPVTRNYRRPKDGFSPFHCAVRGNEYLPKLAFSPYYDNGGQTNEYPGVPSRTILKLLLASGLFDVNAADDDGMTALHHACTLNTEESSALEGITEGPEYRKEYGARGDILLELLSAPDIILDVVDHRGETALHNAVQARNIAHIRVLLAKGASLQVKGAKQIACTLGRHCERDGAIFRDISDFKAHLKKRHWEYFK